MQTSYFLYNLLEKQNGNQLGQFNPNSTAPTWGATKWKSNLHLRHEDELRPRHKEDKHCCVFL